MEIQRIIEKIEIIGKYAVSLGFGPDPIQFEEHHRSRLLKDHVDDRHDVQGDEHMIRQRVSQLRFCQQMINNETTDRQRNQLNWQKKIEFQQTRKFCFVIILDFTVVLHATLNRLVEGISHHE